MWLILIPGLVLAVLMLAVLASPKRVPVRAARARKAKFWQKLIWRTPLTTITFSDTGDITDLSSYFTGQADGDSFKRFGIPTGSTFFGPFVSRDTSGLSASEDPSTLEPGDIVVINPTAAASPSIPWRLRKICKVDGDTAYFEPDPNGEPHNTRSVYEICARVTHVVV